ncbi:hypothetical protein WA026_005651 [Henosepilachna vigintioctopunctata]|uniref:Reverse transcriptase domain-containing protein n=1 Tax=Henosepilachna vigintioctopunctata TaxID=420089 RepID=A0AAW1U3V2_9CUCU
MEADWSNSRQRTRWGGPIRAKRTYCRATKTYKYRHSSQQVISCSRVVAQYATTSKHSPPLKMSLAVRDETSGRGGVPVDHGQSARKIISPCFTMDTGRESLHDFINRLYGEEVYKQVRRFEVLRKKKAHQVSSLIFLLRCRDNNVIPKFLRAKRHFNTAASHRIYNRLERALLRERIHETRRELAKLDSELLSVHLLISQKMNNWDWERVDRIIYNTMSSEMKKSTERQKRKFEQCDTNTKPRPILDVNKTVVNISSHQLSDHEESILAKGGNFAVTPRNVPVEEIIANIEAGIRNLPQDSAEEIRRDCSKILQHARPPKSNIPYTERRALKDLRNNKDIIILPADKGNATTVLNTVDYHQKVQDLLKPENYKMLKRDPTASILRKTNDLIKNSSIPEELQKKIKVSEALSPRLYGLPKIHKPDVPLRPIVSAIGSPTYNLAKHLTRLLQPHVGQSVTFIKDSSHFIEKLKLINVRDTDILVSFDVVSLFTKVPVTDALLKIDRIFPRDISTLFRHVLTTTYFQYNNVFYEQKDGVAMGSPLSPVIANSYMEEFEEVAIRNSPLKPTHWYRYVDDTFVVWSHGQEKLLEFLNHLNSIHPQIQFTMEKEENGQLAFLDVLVKRREDGSLGHTVYRKPTHTDRYLHKMSNHHPKQKRAVLRCLSQRASRICEPQSLKNEESHLHQAFQANGYSFQEVTRALRPRKGTGVPPTEEPKQGVAIMPFIRGVTDRIGRLLQRHEVRAIFKPTHQVRNLLRSAKDPRDKLSSAGVYKIPCSCGSVYIGTTKRSIKTRLKEHEGHCRRVQPEKSAVAEHAYNNLEHNIKYDDAEVLSTDRNYHARLQREAIEIHKHRNNFNRKEETMRIRNIWHPALKRKLIGPTADNERVGVDQSERSGHIAEPRRPINIGTLVNRSSVAPESSPSTPLRRSTRRH